MSSTIQAAVICCRNRGATSVTVVTPVASSHAPMALKASADEVIVLLSPPFFRAVADFCQKWYEVPNEELVNILGYAKKSGLLANDKESSK